MVNNSLSSRSVAFMPVVLMAFIHVFVTPLREMFQIEPLLMLGWYGIGATIGIIIFRKSDLVKDHEYRRSKVMKEMKKVYKAEEAGVWQTNAQVDSEFSEVGKAKLTQNIGEINRESPEMEVDKEQEVEVQFLNEAKHVVEATRRVTGETSFDDLEVDSTIGATRKSNPMDSFLDWIGGLFGRKEVSAKREKDRLDALRAASDAAPVVVSRPNTPIQITRREVDSTLKATSMTDEGEEEASLDSINSPTGEKVKVLEQKQYLMGEDAYSWDRGLEVTQSQSLESMAMLPGARSNEQLPNTPSSNQKTCRGCGAIAPKDERFCLNCGLDILP